jgi:hypothetical protein
MLEPLFGFAAGFLTAAFFGVDAFGAADVSAADDEFFFNQTMLEPLFKLADGLLAGALLTVVKLADGLLTGALATFGVTAFGLGTDADFLTADGAANALATALWMAAFLLAVAAFFEIVVLGLGAARGVDKFLEGGFAIVFGVAWEELLLPATGIFGFAVFGL